MTKRTLDADSPRKIRRRVGDLTAQVEEKNAGAAGLQLASRVAAATDLLPAGSGQGDVAVPTAEPVLLPYPAGHSPDDSQKGTLVVESTKQAIAHTRAATRSLGRVQARTTLPYFGPAKASCPQEAGLVPKQPVSPAASLVQDLREHLKTEPDELATLRVAVDKLSATATALLMLQAELLADDPELCRKLKIMVHYPPAEANEQVVDVSCLEPLAEQEKGLVLVSLQVEISVLNGWPKGMYSLLKGGESLLRLGITFVHHDDHRAITLGPYLAQCLRLRGPGLKSLALQDFAQVMSSETLAQVLKQGKPLQVLALNQDQAGELPADFRLTHLLDPGVRTLHLQGLTLRPDHLNGIGAPLGEHCKLRELKIARCELKGDSSDLIRALACNESLETLHFVHNIVETLPPDRFLRLLSQRSKPLKNLHIDNFDDSDFRNWLKELVLTNPDLKITPHGPQGPQLRSGWYPDPIAAIATAPTVQELPSLPLSAKHPPAETKEKSTCPASRKVSWADDFNT